MVVGFFVIILLSVLLGRCYVAYVALDWWLLVPLPYQGFTVRVVRVCCPYANGGCTVGVLFAVMPRVLQYLYIFAETRSPTP